MFGGARESTGPSLEAPINASLAGRIAAAGTVAAIVVTTAAGIPPCREAPAAADQAAAQLALHRRVTAVEPAARSLVRHPRRAVFPPALVFRPMARVSVPNVPVLERSRPRVRPRAAPVRVFVRERPVVRHHRPRAVPDRPALSRRVPRAVVPRRVVVRPAARKVVRGNTVVRFAERQLGRPYVRGGTGRRGFDCSGLTRAAYARVGKRLPHKAARQHGRAVRRSQARPGDLVKWGSYHVGIYIGDGRVIHAPKPGDRVKRSRLWGSYRIVRVR